MKIRLEIAAGAAWFEQEHRELGIDFPGSRERAERLEEAVQARPDPENVTEIV